MEDRQLVQPRAFLDAVRKKQVISVLVLVLKSKTSVTPTLEKQLPLLHPEVVEAAIL